MAENLIEWYNKLSEDWEETIEQETVEKIVGQVSNIANLATNEQFKLLQAIADLSREESNRMLLSKPEIIKSTVELYRANIETPESPLILQCTRVTGNLCYQNAPNRQAFANEGVVPLLSQLLETVSCPRIAQADSEDLRASRKFLLRLAAGVLANLASENDAVQDALLASPNAFLVVFESYFEFPGEIDTVNRAVTNIFQSSKQWSYLASSGSFSRLLTTLYAPHPLRLSVANMLTEILSEATKEDLNFLVPFFVVQEGIVPKILSVLANPSQSEIDTEAAELAEQASLPAFATKPPLERQIVGMLLTKLSDFEAEPVLEAFAPHAHQIFDILQGSDLLARRCVALTLGYLGYHSAPVRELIFERILLLLGILESQKAPQGDSEIQLGLIMSIAVVIDGPEKVANLVAINGHKPLIPFLDQQYDPRIVHQVLGIVRKLSIPPEFKPVLVDAGVIPLINEVLNFSRDVTILYSAVVAIRSLLTLHEKDHQRKILEAAPVVETLMSLWERQFNKDTERVLWEAARALALIILDGWLEQCQAHNAVDKPLGVLIASTYAPLRVEGWAALNVVFASTADPVSKLVTIINTIEEKVDFNVSELSSANAQLLAKALASPDCTTQN